MCSRISIFGEAGSLRSRPEAEPRRLRGGVVTKATAISKCGDALFSSPPPRRRGLRIVRGGIFMPPLAHSVAPAFSPKMPAFLGTPFDVRKDVIIFGSGDGLRNCVLPHINFWRSRKSAQQTRGRAEAASRRRRDESDRDIKVRRRLILVASTTASQAAYRLRRFLYAPLFLFSRARQAAVLVKVLL